MMIAGSILLIVTNLLILGLLWLIWRMVRRRGPMTAAKLRQTVCWDKTEPHELVPCGGDLDVMAALLRALEQGGDARDLLRGYMVQWERTGAILVGQGTKKKLRSFGDDVQEELAFPEELPQLSGAQALLYQRIYSWLPEDGVIQRSELYQAARQEAEALGHVVRQLMQEGQRRLREMGGSMLENRKAKMGFSEQSREIYTQKGVRLASELAAYTKFMRKHLRTGDAAAAVVGGIVPDCTICVLADAIYNGIQAGKQVCR